VREGTIESGRGYVSSDRCRSCHTAQYQSWQTSYHRTMSQVVSSETVMADFGGVELGPSGERYRLERRGDGFWVELPAQALADSPATAPAGLAANVQPAAESGHWRRIVQSTGSHHYQLYWYATGAGRELNMLPFVFLREGRRWAPRDSVFLQPPDFATEKIVWNYQCLPCHSTDGQPGYLPGEAVAPGSKSPDTRVAEMGIACEMCHGPGARHVEAHRAGADGAGPAVGDLAAAPATATVSGAVVSGAVVSGAVVSGATVSGATVSGATVSGVVASGAMVHPSKLPAARAAQICGQCHSVNVPYRPEDWVDYLLDGPRFRPGEDLRKSRYVVDGATLKESPLIGEWLANRQKSLDDWFWPDGVVRVTGREYNGLLKSPCFAGGNFSCLSCHSPHAADPDDQLKAGMRGDQACLHCHQDLGARIAAHTHHDAQSSGSRCYNCHMPHTTYGLLKASRSHTIESPSARVTLESGRPNACNLCHLDRTLAWTAGYLSEWYGQPGVAVGGDAAAIAAAALGLLKGDAGLRAIYAWHMGWPEARQASGERWLAPFLAQTLTDPYDVVRYISGRSLRVLPEFAAFPYDFVGAPAERRQAAAEAMRLWNASRAPAAGANHTQILLGADGSLDVEAVRRILEQRDNRPVLLAE
jgi:predicted CXXCH cytochrome family protein